MKKIFLTLSLVTLFSVAVNAQDKTTKKDNGTNTTNTTKESTQTAPNSAAVNPDGTAVTPAPAATTEKKEASPAPKKSGTRMAINEKGLPGGSSKKESSTTKDEKANSPK